VTCLLLFQTAVVSCSVVVLILSTAKLFRSPFLYYVLVVGVAGFLSVPILLFYFQRDFVSWLFYFICQDVVKVFIIVNIYAIKSNVYYCCWSSDTDDFDMKSAFSVIRYVLMIRRRIEKFVASRRSITVINDSL
jgi:hypothetical protein